MRQTACDRCTQGVMDAGHLRWPGNDHLYGRCTCDCHQMETSANPAALAEGRRPEQHALQNENPGERWDRADCITLRCVAAIHQRIVPGPRPDALSSV